MLTFHAIIMIILILFFFYNQGGQNFSSSQMQLQVPGNRTIQRFVKAYVDKYIGGYFLACLMTVLSTDFIFLILLLQNLGSERETSKCKQVFSQPEMDDRRQMRQNKKYFRLERFTCRIIYIDSNCYNNHVTIRIFLQYVTILWLITFFLVSFGTSCKCMPCMMHVWKHN